MKYRVLTTTRFNKDVKRCKKRGLDMSKLKSIVEILAHGEKLPAKYHEHTLKGEYAGIKECHINPDWLLMWKQNDKEQYNVDVGVVTINTKDENGLSKRKQLEVDFVCNKGSRRYYIQSALNLDTTEKQEQEFNSLNRIDDNFKKIVIVGGSALLIKAPMA